MKYQRIRCGTLVPRGLDDDDVLAQLAEALGRLGIRLRLINLRNEILAYILEVLTSVLPSDAQSPRSWPRRSCARW